MLRVKKDIEEWSGREDDTIEKSNKAKHNQQKLNQKCIQIMDYGFNRRECENNNKCMLYKIVLCYFVGWGMGDVGGCC